MPVRVKMPDEMLMIPMDATLIEQVLVNLMDKKAYLLFHSIRDELLYAFSLKITFISLGIE